MNHTVLSADAESSGRSSASAFENTLSNLGVEGKFLNTVRVIYENSTANTIHVESFPVRSGRRQGAGLTASGLLSTSKNNQTRKRNKRHLYWKYNHCYLQMAQLCSNTGIRQEALIPNELIQNRCRIQNQHIPNSITFLCTKDNLVERNQENNLI